MQPNYSACQHYRKIAAKRHWLVVSGEKLLNDPPTNVGRIAVLTRKWAEPAGGTQRQSHP